MTFSLRRKRRTTAGHSTPRRMGVSLIAVGFLLGAAGTSFAQTGGLPAASPPAPVSTWSNASEPVLQFEKDPDSTEPASQPSPLMRFTKDTPTATTPQPKSLA